MVIVTTLYSLGDILNSHDSIVIFRQCEAHIKTTAIFISAKIFLY